MGQRVLSSAPPRALPPSSAQHPRGTAQALGVIGTSQAPGRPLPLVLVATSDSSLARRFSALLDPRAEVRRVRNAAALVQEISDAGSARSVVVLDCNEPSIRPIALAALADDLPMPTRVIIWGASDEVRSELCLVSERAACFLYTGPESDPRDVADQCAELVS